MTRLRIANRALPTSIYLICFVSGHPILYIGKLTRYNLQDQIHAPYVDWRHMNDDQNISDAFPLNGAADTANTTQWPIKIQQPWILPHYIRELPRRLRSGDVNYLRAKGALKIPADELRNELLKCYFHCVHSHMPVLDIDDILHAIALNDGVHRVGLLLFQAVMFAGASFISEEHLHNAGFPNRRDAQKCFFNKSVVCALASLQYNC